MRRLLTAFALLTLSAAALAATPSPNDTVVVTPSTATITDATGNLWGLTLSAAALAATPSPNDTVVVAPSTATITDAAGNTWGINATAPCTATWAPKGGVSEVTKNATLDGNTCNVKEIAYVNGVVWQENTGGAWYSWGGTAWVASTNPLPAAPTYPTSATLSWTAPTTYTTGAPITVPLTYNVYCGATATALSKVANVSTLSYVLSAASTTATTYYCSVTAIAAGQESTDSNEVSTTIALGPPTLIPSAPVLIVNPNVSVSSVKPITMTNDSLVKPTAALSSSLPTIVSGWLLMAKPAVKP